MIYNKKYNLNNLNFLLSGKDIKYETYNQIKANAPSLVKEFHKDYPLRPTLAGQTRYESKQLPPNINTRNTIAGNSKLKKNLKYIITLIIQLYNI